MNSKYKYKKWRPKKDQYVKVKIKTDLNGILSISLSADGRFSANIDKYVAVTSTYM